MTGLRQALEESWFRLEIRKILYVLLMTARVRMLFYLGIGLEALNITIGAATYHFLKLMFASEAEIMTRYSTDVVSYIILGMALGSLLMTSLTGFYGALSQSYVDRTLERILMTPTSIYTLLGARMAGNYLSSIIYSALYLVVGVAVFGVRVGGANLAVAAMVFLGGVVATVGLGMLLCQVFFYTATGKGGVTPVTVSVATFAQTFSGAAFPIENLPSWLRVLSSFLPQTHALRATRLLLAGGSLSTPVIRNDLVYLAVFVAVALPIGVALMRKGMRRLKKEGYVPLVGDMLMVG